MNRVDDIMNMIAAEYSWEQVIHKVIAWEGLDPWDLDLVKLSESFIYHISKIEELDFRVPAKYILIAAVLLRMKSDYLRIAGVHIDEEHAEIIDAVDEEMQEVGAPFRELMPGPMPIPARRRPMRKMVVDDLISALRKALNSQERREARHMRARAKIDIRADVDITQRINELYGKISGLLLELKDEEVRFSNLVGNWERQEIVNTFLPLIYLDNARKVNCRQEEMFEEIFIRKRKAGKKAE